MTLTNKLKPQVDLPVWEWCRFAPLATTAVSSLTTGNSLSSRYLYHQVSGTLYRYDTYTDSWHQLATNPLTPTIFNANVYSSAMGHFGQAIGSGGGNNTMQLAGLNGDTLVGYKIRIIGGTGAGQERTITAVSAPIVADRGVVTAVTTSSLTDASTGVGIKQWKVNQWRNYQVRIDFGTGKLQMRPILWNSANQLTWADAGHIPLHGWSQPILPTALSATAGAQSLYVIESHIITVDTNWSVNPDSTSQFQIISGGIWNFTQATTSAPFMSMMYYDVIADVWYYKSTITGIKAAVFAASSDVSMERMTESGGAIASGTSTSAGARSITNTGAGMTPMQYANFEIRITSGAGKGQSRSILSNTDTVINVTRDWDVTPDATSTYEIWRDTGKVWLIGGGDAGMLQYSAESDQITTGKQLDFGVVCQLAAKLAGERPQALTSITRVTGSITSLGSTPTAGGSGYNVNDILTITTGGSSGTARVLSVSSTGAVLSVALETTGNGYTTGTGKATTVSPAGGTSCTLNILTIGETAVATSANNHTFKIGDVVTISGANQSEYNGAKTILGVPSVTGFTYLVTGSPATPATFTAPSTTVLVDVTKNWVVNEHVGKLVQLATNATYATGQVRRIISNTATTLTWTLAATAPVNGTRYVIEDIKPFGTEITTGGRIGGGTEGFATGGSLTTLVDSTKNWPINYWSRTVGRKVRIVEGTGVGNEITILSNTADTLTYASQSFTPDATTRYVIMDAFGTATAGSTTTLTDSAQNWETNIWAGKRVRFLSGTGQGNEYAIVSNTATVLTFAAGTAPDVSTAYAILESPPRYYGVHLDMIIGCSNPAINHKYMYAWTGTTTAELMRYNVTTEHWERMTYTPLTETLTSGSMFVYDGADRIYFTKESTGRIMYYDVVKNIVVPSSTIPYGMSTAITGNRMEIVQTADGLKYLYVMRHTGQEMFRTLLFW